MVDMETMLALATWAIVRHIVVVVVTALLIIIMVMAMMDMTIVVVIVDVQKNARKGS